MLTIAITQRDRALIEPVTRAYPGAQLVLRAIPEIEEMAAEHRLFGFIVGPHAFGKTSAVDLAMLKGRFPELPIIAVLPLTAGVHRHMLELGRAHVDTLIHEFEDHPANVREVFNRAGVGAVAQVVAHVCQRDAPTLVAQNVLRALNRLRDLHSSNAFATALDRSLRALGQELHGAALPPPRILLPWLRVLRGSRHLQDTTDGRLDQLARHLGYRSVRALLNAFHRLLATTPSEVRRRGGLWYASERFRLAMRA
jgi:hypothetical protein